METEALLPYSQKPIAGPYIVQNESNPRSSYFSKYILYGPLLHVWISHNVSSYNTFAFNCFI
jgi:hypothetical protein